MLAIFFPGQGVLSGFRWSVCFISQQNIFKISNKNIRKRCEICSKLTLKTPEWHQWGACLVYNQFISTYSKRTSTYHIFKMLFFLFWKTKCCSKWHKTVFFGLYNYSRINNFSAQRKACDICSEENQATNVFFS